MKAPFNVRTLQLLAISAVTVFTSATLLAQGEETMEEVLVTGSYILSDRIDTATGLGLTLRETPQSVSVFTEQQIFDQNLETIADVVIGATGVSVNEIDDVRNTFNARGFEINNYQVDGVPLAYTLAGGAGETMLDAVIYERIEIVRGATGLLTGVGDPSASINLVRKSARHQDITGYVSSSIGRWNNIKLAADVAGGLNDDGTVRGRAVAKYQEGESNVNLFEDQKLVLYGVVEADLGDATQFTAGASHQQETPTAPAWGALPSFYTDGTFIDWPRSQTSSADWTYWDTINQNIFATLAHEFTNGWEFSANYNWLKNSQKTEILYLYIDSFAATPGIDPVTGLGLVSFPYSDDGNNTQNSLDLQLKGSYGLFDAEHEFVVGALYSEQTYVNDTYAALAFPAVGDYSSLQDGSFPNPNFSNVANREVDMDTQQHGLYATTRLNVTDSFKAVVGGRLTSWNREGFDFGPEFDFGDDNEFVPYVGVLYDLVENHTLYASYTEIFQPQNAQDQTGSFLDPLTGTNYELGLKSEFFNGALQTSFAIFEIKQDNLAQLAPGQFIPGTPFPASQAVEGTTSEGYEFEVVGSPTDNWNITFGFSDFDATEANGADVNSDHPRKLVNLFTTYSFTDSLAGLVLGGGINWRGEMYTDTVTTTLQPFRMEQEAYALIDIMARYDLNEQMSVQANIDNLTDETYFSQVGFYQQYRYGKPRSYSLSLNYAF